MEHSLDGARSPLRADPSAIYRGSSPPNIQRASQAHPETGVTMDEEVKPTAHIVMPERDPLTSWRYNGLKLPWLGQKTASHTAAVLGDESKAQQLQADSDKAQDKPTTLPTSTPGPGPPSSPLLSKPLPQLPPAEPKHAQPRKVVRINTGGHGSSKSPTSYSPSVYSHIQRSETSAETVVPPSNRPLDSYERLVVQPEETESESLQRAVVNLEELVHEAIAVAEDAARDQHSDDAREILEEATNAMLNAEAILDRQPSGPLRVSDFNTNSERSSTKSVGSSVKVDKRSYETMLTVDSTDGQPVTIAQYKRNGKAPASEQAEVVIEVGRPQLQHAKDHNRRYLCDLPGGEPPASFSKPSHESIIIDWAYVHSHRKRSDTSLSSSNSTTSSLRKTPVGLRMRRINLPLEPSTSKSPERDQVGLVVRALPNRQAVHEHIEKYERPPHMPRHSSRQVRATESYNRRSTDDKELFYDSKVYPVLDPNTPGLSLKHKNHLSLLDRQGFSLARSHRHQPLARNWSTVRKRIAAAIACINTALIGIMVGVYAGEVPAIQYMIADEQHLTILGNTFLYLGVATTTFLFWPLPLLHGRRPYTLGALAFLIPLQFPQALSVNSPKANQSTQQTIGLLLSRGLSGIAVGFMHMNTKATLFDLFGSSLQSANPHQEFVLVDDVRRHGGGMGLWLGIYSWCFIGSVAVGFLMGAGIISSLKPSWGFYITMILLAAVLVLDVIAPETRRNSFRKTVAEITNPDETISRRLARGEITMHLTGTGPKHWIDEVFSGVQLNFRMLRQAGFLILAVYLGWIYAQVVLVVVLLGALLSRDYELRPEYVGLGVLSVAAGALMAVPLAKASFLSRARSRGPRTDSMTFEPRVTRTSHLVRRVIFMTALPFADGAYTIASGGSKINYMVPIVLAGVIGFLSNLAIAECHGLIMETFDTSDLQPGANSKHRLASMASSTRRRRTNYSSYPRVSSGISVAHTLAFLFAAASTAVGGIAVRRTGAQVATGIVAVILLGLTILLTLVLWRFKKVQVIPNEIFGTGGRRVGRDSVATHASSDSWKAVIIGNPSGKVRRMNVLELGKQSRWTEIRRLNRLLRD